MRAHAPSDTAILIARGILLSAKDQALSAAVAAGEAEALRRMLGVAGSTNGSARPRPRK